MNPTLIMKFDIDIFAIDEATQILEMLRQALPQYNILAIPKGIDLEFLPEPPKFDFSKSI